MEVPRPAATVVVAREGDPGPEVLVLRRGAGHRFLPGLGSRIPQVDVPEGWRPDVGAAR